MIDYEFCEKKIHIVDICQNHSFFSFLQLTKKYHEFVAGESLASCGISIFFSMLFYLTLSIDIMNDISINHFEFENTIKKEDIDWDWNIY